MLSIMRINLHFVTIMNDLSSLFGRFNPWWSGTYAIDFKERKVFDEVSKYLNSKQILALTGLRRTGKTTILRKTISDYLTRGFEAKRIFFFSFDDFEIELLALIEEYEKTTGLLIKEGKFLIVLDEVQKLRNWAEQVKILYDLYAPSVKILVSGSESLFIKKKSKESLAGRIYEFKVEPLSFREFLEFKGIKFEVNSIYENVLKIEFENYFKTQGFPELVNENNPEKITRYLQEGIVEKIIYIDLPKTFKIRNVETLKQLLRVIIENPGQIREVENLASQFKASRAVISNYLNYLQDAFLVKKLYNYSGSVSKQERKLKKFYSAITSTALIFSLSGNDRAIAFENFTVTKLNAARHFWRDERKNEVDIVLTKGSSNDAPFPIEVKYGKIAYNGVIAFMRRFNLSKATIISKDEESTVQVKNFEIKIIPLWKYLLLQNNKS